MIDHRDRLIDQLVAHLVGDLAERTVSGGLSQVGLQVGGLAQRQLDRGLELCVRPDVGQIEVRKAAVP